MALLDDALVEGPETFGFRVTYVGAAILDPATPAVVPATITDDD